MDIIALDHAFTCHFKLFRSFESISLHTQALTRYAEIGLRQLSHFNDQLVCKIHDSFDDSMYIDPIRGPIIGFTVFTSQGNPVGHVEFERLAALHGFALRTGGLCNTGVLATTFDLDDNTLQSEYQRGRVCWDDEEFVSSGSRNGQPLGIVRISFGAFSNLADVQTFLNFVQRYFSTPELTQKAPNFQPVMTECSISQVTICESERIDETFRFALTSISDPIKSCAEFICPVSWPVRPHGLLYDRQWLLVNARNGVALSQKKYPRMISIRPAIDLKRNVLSISLPAEFGHFELPIDNASGEYSGEDTRVCADTILVQRPTGQDIEIIEETLSSFLGVECYLRYLPFDIPSRFAHTPISNVLASRPPPPMLLSNESPFLLISQTSVNQVNSWLKEGHSSEILEVSPTVFRANFLLAGILKAFSEDAWDLVKIGNLVFQVLGTCRRCQMICIDQRTGTRLREPLSTLTAKRRNGQGRVTFGVHLMLRPDLSSGTTISNGDPIEILSLQ